jgi:catechol 2,3-dioxygenase-like lactoylglutathione lyase family enzyme
MLTRFDHLTIVVHDLDRAAHTFTRLCGLPLRWRGTHPGMGTQAALLALGNGLLELVGPQADAPEAEGMRGWLASHGEGLQALAFGTDDLDACSSQLRERGLRTTPPEAGEALGMDGRTRSYRACELSPKSTRGLNVLVVERPDAPQLMAAEAELPPGSVEALDHVVIASADLDAAARFYGEQLGLRLALDTVRGSVRMLFFRMGRVTIEVVHDGQAAAKDKLFGAAYRVRDLQAAHARLTAAGFDLSDVRAGRKPGTHVFTVNGAVHGVETLFIRDPARD